MNAVAILDDGICSTCFPFLTQIKKSIAVTANGDISLVQEPDTRTHGTLCAAVLRLYAPDAEIISVQVLDSRTHTGSIEQIRIAMEWCIAHDISLINLSVGSVNFRDWKILKPTISKLIKKNIPLICACSNKEKFSIFTDFSWPISVEKEDSLRDAQYHPKCGNFLEGDFCASSSHTFLLSDNRIESFVSQNSHATPVITANVFHLLNKYGTLPIEKLRFYLQRNFAKAFFHIKPLPDFIDTAVVIGDVPYSAELLTFSLEQNKSFENPFFLAVFPNHTFNAESIARNIRGWENNMRGLLFSGIAPEEIKELVRRIGCLFWDESEYINAAKKLPHISGPTPIPRILFQTANTLIAKLALRLHDKLVNKGYRSKLFSDWHHAYCLGMIFLAEPINTPSYIDYFINHYQLDIVLMCSSKIEMEYDLVISSSADSILLAYDTVQDEYDCSLFSLEQIIEIILNLLL